MGLEAVLEEIREKGRKEADAIRAESKMDSDRILAEADQKVAGIKAEAEEASTKQAARVTAQEISAANLLVKREILNTQKGLLDEVYEGTIAEIAKLPESFHREAIKKLLTEAKKEIPKGKIHCNARDEAAAKAVLAEKEFSGFILGEPAHIDGGILIEGEGGELQIDYSYRTFMNKVWESGLKDASDILFG
ncbi:H+-transporting two-sector ATPase, E subunit [Methanoregula boonei 6A8]|uniref:A-type ATP synthase subunit E n=1 Tax=Methanoregula boonei (strain DSM 21154 / JCM 14090 / 6A8) TaxID=456442 RepID=AATE_METB6|nr:V-type ATP synthase subunit E family protein [Methanoregula boonei]A7IAV1.1 RecName: Full=V-type ATP synthase subunit E; AltName: Full=V-ATPase subunit E [Methanoregula boonei 6A8]ABS56862.1 H+-transporting two-sector ATPase, E subunit [Methanoregula boonei 6A8]